MHVRRSKVTSALLTMVLVGTMISAGTVATAAATASPAVTAGLYQVPSGVAADCSVDVTAQLLAWFASVPDGTSASPNTLQFGANACYRVEGTVLVLQRNWLSFDGNGATFRATTLGKLDSTGHSMRSHWQVEGGTNIALRNMRVEGTNTTSDAPTVCPQCGTYDPVYEFEAGFKIVGANGVDLENLSVDAVWGDGLQLFGGSLDAPDLSRNVHVNGLTISRNGRQGVTFDDVRGALAENVHILGSRRSGFDFEPPSTAFRVRDIEVRTSDVWAVGDAFAAAGSGMADNVFIHDNTVSHGWFLQLGSPYRRSDWKIWNNVATNQGTGMNVANVDNVDVRNNVLHSYPVAISSALFTNVGGTVTVVGNDFRWGCRSYGSDLASAPILAYDNRIGTCTVAPRADHRAPVVRLQAPTPADGSTVSGVVTVSALAGDSVAVATVQFVVDGVVLATLPAPFGSNPYVFTLDTTTLAGGAHRLVVAATDTSANVGTATVNVTVANAR